MTVSEASAVNRLLDFVLGGRVQVEPDEVLVLAGELGDRAYRTLGAGWTRTKVEAKASQCRSALGAVAVAEALQRHVSHGGALPWPTVRRPFEAWLGHEDGAGDSGT